jgi:uncharacterized protein YodC (DUF2158 family)
MKLSERYSKETGNCPWIEYAHVAGPTQEFLAWIENKFIAMKEGNMEIGSVVMLKSGGARMTIVYIPSRIGEDTEDYRYFCHWFENGILNKECYSKKCLIEVKDELEKGQGS